MIGPIDIRINAAHPNIPLAPLYAFIGSPSSVRVRGVPLRIGKWDITAVNVTITLPDNSATTVPAVPVAGCWVATLPASPVTGYCASGLQVTADGLDENGVAVTGYCLGVGDVTILSRDASASADGKRYYLHYLEDEPEHPQTGDTCYIGGVLKWYDGTSWRQFLAVVAPSTSATPGTAADAKATGDAIQLTLRGPNHDGYSMWTIKRDGVDVTSQVGQPQYDDSDFDWHVGGCIVSDDEITGTGTAEEENPNATSLSWFAAVAVGEDVGLSVAYTATRTVLPGYVLGTQTDKPLQPQGDYYQKPSGGIPKTDLASAVQTSLGLADTAVQPSGLAGLLPMYALGATPAIDGQWHFTGDIESDPTKYSIVWSGEDGWDLYYDGNHVSEVAGSESDTTVEFTGAGASGGDVYANLVNVLTVSPYTSATYTATSTAAAFDIAVGALPTGVTGKLRDCELVIDCTATGAVAPTVTWPSNFHPRTDAETDLAIVEAGKVAVFYISEYASGQFAVGGWQVTEGGYTPSAQSGGSGT